MAFSQLSGKWPILLAGLGLALMLLLLKWIEARFTVIEYSMEIYIGSLALIFTLLGIWLSNRLFNREKTIVVEKEIIIRTGPDFVQNEKAVLELGLSARELDVLQLMAEGLSNQEIADRLFVSLNTVKTHSSNLLSKLDVKRRTQAVDKAKKLGIIP